MRRLVLVLGAGLLSAGMLTACAGAGGGATPNPPPTPNAPAATAEQLVGTWVVDATFDVPTQPFLTLVGDGSWTGSDGCNGVQGTWAVAAGGELTVEAGPSTLIYCDGKPLPRLFASARRASVAEGTLTLSDASGAVTATLVPGREDLTPVNSPAPAN
jgi:heat shock protein HslJ